MWQYGAYEHQMFSYQRKQARQWCECVWVNDVYFIQMIMIIGFNRTPPQSICDKSIFFLRSLCAYRWHRLLIFMFVFVHLDKQERIHIYTLTVSSFRMSVRSMDDIALCRFNVINAMTMNLSPAIT